VIRRSGKYAAAFLTAALVLASAGLRGDEKKPDDVFRKIFFALESTMGITINPSKFQVKLLSGKVVVPSIVLKHPVQGTWAVIKNAEFPLGLLFGTVKAEKADVRVGKIDVKLDLGKAKFWDRGTKDGKPMSGAPNLVAGKICFDSANITLTQGGSAALRIKNARATLSKVKIPAEAWSRGDAPMGPWAKAHFKGGTIALDGPGLEADLKKLSVSFNSEIMTLGALEIDVPGRGTLRADGRVDCLGAEPGAYDLSVDVTGFVLSPGSPGSAAGTLKLKGKKGALKVTGKLTADEIRETGWKRDSCSSAVKLAVGLEQKGKKPGKTGSISGNFCKGKISLK
jgi:hypothetical protein